jgi:predicted dehydrogenase
MIFYRFHINSECASIFSRKLAGDTPSRVTWYKGRWYQPFNLFGLLMASLVRVGLVGISGYGESYMRAILDDPSDPDFKLVAVADPNAQRSARVDQLRQQSVAIYPSIDELCDKSEIDLLMMASPLQMHAKHIRQTRDRGINVLCEKPLAATFDQARQLAIEDTQARQAAAATFAAIGFQWSFSAAVQALKQDVMRGEFGAPVRLKTIVLYPRPTSYYARNCEQRNIAFSARDALHSWSAA